MSDLLPPAKPSGRKGSRKVRSGCITCKTRKVKCDETKPSCERCVKSGRSCDGYLDPSLIHTRRRRTPKNLTTVADSPSSPRSPSTGLTDLMPPEERRSFHFFQHVTAPQLAGDLDAFFWRVMVLQVCHAEPSVRHAVLAVSSLHEALTTTSSGAAAPCHALALQQYNKAIACLLVKMKDAAAGPLAPLLTCVLFVCLEFMHGKDRESIIHLEQGRKILSRLGVSAMDPPSQEMDFVKTHLVPLYLRLSLTSFLFGGLPMAIPDSLKPPHRLDASASFESAHELRFVLYDFLDECMRLMHRARMARYADSDVDMAEMLAEIAPDQRNLLRRLERFGCAVEMYQGRHPGEVGESTAALFQMYLLVMNIWVATALRNSEAAFDEHLPSFAAILPLAATILDSCDKPPQSASRQPDQPDTPTTHIQQARNGNPRGEVFKFETSVIPVLYHVATKCRQGLVRHAAIDLLRHSPRRRENLWHARRMAAIAEHIVRLEEAEAARGCEPVPTCTLMMPHVDQVMGLPEFSGQDPAESGGPTGPITPPGYGYTSQSQRETYPLALETDNYDLPVDPHLLTDMSGGGDGLSSPLASSYLVPTHGLGMTSDVSTSPWLHPPAPGGPSRSRAVSVCSAGLHSQAGEWEPLQRQQQHSHPFLVRSSSSGSSPGSQAVVDVASPAEGRPWRQLAAEHRRRLVAMSAPFDIPEHTRVHDVIIVPEQAQGLDGSWLTLFRRLHGPAEDWHVQTEFVMV